MLCYNRLNLSQYTNDNTNYEINPQLEDYIVHLTSISGA